MTIVNRVTRLKTGTANIIAPLFRVACYAMPEAVQVDTQAELLDNHQSD